MKRGRNKPPVIPSEARNLSKSLAAFLSQIPRFARNDNQDEEAAKDFVSQRVRKATRLLGKYGSTSLIATAADFAMFHVALAYLGATPVLATIIGRSVGSAVSFVLHRSWVFRYSKNRDGNVLRLKYVAGIFIGLGLNAAGVWFLNGMAGMEPWPARIATATTVWFFGFLFNKKIVFG